MSDCIDLRERFGHEYRIELDPAAGKLSSDPWMFTIPCRKGTIYPHGGDKIGVEVAGRRAADRLAAIPGATLHQDGDREWTVLFPVEAFGAVAEVVQPRRKRRLSPEHREKLRLAGAAFHFRTVPSVEKQR